MEINARNEVVNNVVDLLSPLTTVERTAVLRRLIQYRRHWFTKILQELNKHIREDRTLRRDDGNIFSTGEMGQ